MHTGMHLDHVSYAAGPEGLVETARWIGEQIGVEPVDGGRHPRFGTANMVLPLAEDRYIEVVEALEHPASYQQPFGQAVRARSESGGGWLGWVVAVKDIAPVEALLGREAVDGSRHRPDGEELRWKQIGVKGLIADPQVPFIIQWLSGPEQHPSTSLSSQVRLESLQIAGDPQRVRDWVGLKEGQYWYPHEVKEAYNEVELEFVAPHGNPGVMSVAFVTADGTVRI